MMDTLKAFLKFENTKKNASWHVIFPLACSVIYSEIFATILIFQSKFNGSLIIGRMIHLLMGVLSIFILLKFKNKWKFKYSMWAFFLLVLPWYPINWYSQINYIVAGKVFTPFNANKLYPIILAFLVPGPYWINVALISLFYLEAVCLWFYLDMGNLNFINQASEPSLTIMYALVAYTLLYFRYRDEKIIAQLMEEKAQSAVYRNLSRIFLTMRDRTNTPLQMQKIISNQLLCKNPENRDLAVQLDLSIRKIEEMNFILRRFEYGLDIHKEQMLMSDEDISDYLCQIETAQRKNKSESTK